MRNVILKDLSQINAQVVTHIHETATQLTEIKDFLSQETDANWKRVVSETEDALSLDITKLQQLHLALQKEIVYRAIATVAGSKKDLGQVHVMDVLALCNNQSGKEVHLPYQICAKKEYDTIRVEKRELKLEEKKEISLTLQLLEDCRKEKECLEVSIGDCGESLQIRIFEYSPDFAKIPKNTYTKWMDYDKIKQGFCIRNRNVGDYFICDDFGHRKKLKQYMIDEKIPANERSKMWLLAQEDKVLWLVGGRMSEHIKVTEQTKTVIEIAYQGGH